LSKPAVQAVRSRQPRADIDGADLAARQPTFALSTIVAEKFLTMMRTNCLDPSDETVRRSALLFSDP